jgi:F420-dependent oxidoreductase-like protein
VGIVRVSITLSNYSWPEGPSRLPQRLAEVVQAADDAGVDTVWVPDHLLQVDPTAGPNDRDMLEAYTTLGFLAAKSERVRLGTMVSAVTYREPTLLITAVNTLAVLTAGRAWLGIGAGYHAEEAAAMGLSLPPAAERFDRLEEFLQIAQRLWDGDESSFEGTHYQLAAPRLYPQPDRRPGILIGGTGRRRTLRLVARYADACNVFDIPDGGVTIRENLAVLARHCRDTGRPYTSIEKTLSTRLAPGQTSGDFIRHCAGAAEWGIGHAVVLTPQPWSREGLAVIAAAVQALRDVEPAESGS